MPVRISPNRQSFLVGDALQCWLEKAAIRQEAAWAPGTIANYRSAIKRYILFCYEMDLTPTEPRYQNLCAYIEYLKADISSPRTIANHLSHIRNYLRKAQVTTDQVDNFRVKCAMTAIKRDNSHTPRIKEAFPVQTLQQMVIALPNDIEGLLIKVSILIMYYAALRQSEVLSYSVGSYDPYKNLSRRDVIVSDHALTVHISHAKNQQSIYETKSLVLQPSSNPSLCVVSAVRDMYHIIPTVHLDDPCIMFATSRRPVTIEFVRRYWMQHLKRHHIDTSALSLHSIRKAAATAAHQSGCPEIDIQRYGGWRSNAHRSYITTSQRHVNSAITYALSQ